MATAFPQNQKTYAILMSPATTIQKIQNIADAVSRADADNIAVWSVIPFDITVQPIWGQIQSLLAVVTRNPLVVEQVTQADVDAASSKISVVEGY